jgi:hypothetical protein
MDSVRNTAKSVVLPPARANDFATQVRDRIRDQLVRRAAETADDDHRQSAAAATIDAEPEPLTTSTSPLTNALIAVLPEGMLISLASSRTSRRVARLQRSTKANESRKSWRKRF